MEMGAKHMEARGNKLFKVVAQRWSELYCKTVLNFCTPVTHSTPFPSTFLSSSHLTTTLTTYVQTSQMTVSVSLRPVCQGLPDLRRAEVEEAKNNNQEKHT